MIESTEERIIRLVILTDAGQLDMDKYRVGLLYQNYAYKLGKWDEVVLMTPQSLITMVQSFGNEVWVSMDGMMNICAELKNKELEHLSQNDKAVETILTLAAKNNINMIETPTPDKIIINQESILERIIGSQPLFDLLNSYWDIELAPNLYQYLVNDNNDMEDHIEKHILNIWTGVPEVDFALETLKCAIDKTLPHPIIYTDTKLLKSETDMIKHSLNEGVYCFVENIRFEHVGSDFDRSYLPRCTLNLCAEESITGTVSTYVHDMTEMKDIDITGLFMTISGAIEGLLSTSRMPSGSRVTVIAPFSDMATTSALAVIQFHRKKTTRETVRLLPLELFLKTGVLNIHEYGIGDKEEVFIFDLEGAMGEFRDDKFMGVTCCYTTLENFKSLKVVKFEGGNIYDMMNIRYKSPRMRKAILQLRKAIKPYDRNINMTRV